MVSKMCEVDFREDIMIGASDVREISPVNKGGEESDVYLEVLSFLREIFNLVGFSEIIKGANKRFWIVCMILSSFGLLQ